MAPRIPALLLGVSLSVGAVAFPVPAPVTPPVSTLTPTEPVNLDLLTVGESLFPAPLDTSRIEDRLLREKLRENFFRNEIPWGVHIYREARNNNLPPELVAAVIRTESDFRPRLVSNKNAIGLMQVLPSTGQFMGAGNIEDPIENIRVGTRYLRYLNRKFNGNHTLVLAAYNAGPGAVRRYGGVPPFRETQNYVRKVQRIRSEYSARVARRAAFVRNNERLRQALEPSQTSFAGMLGNGSVTGTR